MIDRLVVNLVCRLQNINFCPWKSVSNLNDFSTGGRS